MVVTSLSQLASILDARLIGDDRKINAISTDTRTIDNDCLFIALIGERFDAHQFINNAIQSGASAVLVSKQVESSVPQLIVSDTKVALGLIGAWVHQQCEIPTVAITGSCGKTTVKEMVASILALKGEVMFTQGNFNNDIGVPLTLLRSEPQHDYAVVELGANHIGEIAYTTKLVQPNIALVNNVASAHIEGFGSLDGVKQAKGEIYSGLSSNGLALVNLDSCSEQWWDGVLNHKRVMTLSTHNSRADFYAEAIALNQDSMAEFTLVTPSGRVDVTLAVVGVHNVSNAISAAAISYEFGASLSEIAQGLHSLSFVKGRVEITELNNRIKLIDDSYNASVPAMLAAVDLLSTFQGDKWLILGNMAELGNESLALHRQVGEHAAPFKFKHILTYGDDAKVISDVCHGRHFVTHQDMMNYVEQQLEQNTTHAQVLLVKGANSAGMSKIAAVLKEKFL
ncbi:UDP-N-acetylmuramoyl-tripeptide--D-alanyl-D-alanine ligase [Vibrio sp. WJH972]